VLQLKSKDDIATVLSVNAATITDNYWVKPLEDNVTQYNDIRFKMNNFADLALTGDVNSLTLHPSRTPELTNIGSFEKCWRLENNEWWMYKAGKQEELFSELLAYRIGKELGLDIAEYEATGEYIRNKDFTSSATVDFEPAAAIIGDESDYIDIYEKLIAVDLSFELKILMMYYFDALILNMDRHEYNFGILRDSDTGQIISLAPLFDHNLCLISRGYPMQDPKDILISDITSLLQYSGKQFVIPRLTKDNLLRIVNEIPFEPSKTELVQNPRNFVVEYILKRQEVIAKQNSNVITYT